MLASNESHVQQSGQRRVTVLLTGFGPFANVERNPSELIVAELAQTVDDVILIDHGRLIARGSTADLMARHQSASLEELFLGLVSNGTQS